MELAKRLAAAKGFRWAVGMSGVGDGFHCDARVIDVDHGTPCLPDQWEYKGYLRGRENDDDWWAEMAPDLADAATIGCVEEQAREVWAGLGATARLSTVDFANGRWMVAMGGVSWFAPTRGEAWALCLLAGLERAA